MTGLRAAAVLVLALLAPVAGAAQQDGAKQDGIPQGAAQQDGAQQDGVRLDPAASHVTAQGKDRGTPRPLALHLSIGDAAPYRVYLLDAPPRLVIEVQGLALPTRPAPLAGSDHLAGLRWGGGMPGWGRIVAELPGPYALSRAALTGGGTGDAAIDLTVTPVDAAQFAPRRDDLTALRGLPQPAQVGGAARAATGPDPLRVMIDPGHGGIDPGAQVGAISEAALMLGFARELAAALARAGFQPVLTRDDDRFIPLERRTTAARGAGADLFISLHADMLPQGQAAGATIYVWNPESDDRAARELASRHDRDDMLAGVDLDGTDDQVARALIDLARSATQPRSEAFARHLSAEMSRTGVDMHRRPVRGAAFSVLKSPDIPSVLVELGFLSDPVDRGNLFSPEWRAGTADAIARAIAAWQADGGARAALSAPATPGAVATQD